MVVLSLSPPQDADAMTRYLWCDEELGNTQQIAQFSIEDHTNKMLHNDVEEEFLCAVDDADAVEAVAGMLDLHYFEGCDNSEYDDDNLEHDDNNPENDNDKQAPLKKSKRPRCAHQQQHFTTSPTHKVLLDSDEENAPPPQSPPLRSLSPPPCHHAFVANALQLF